MDQATAREYRRLTTRPDRGVWEPGDAYVAGGTWLMSEPQPALRRLVDITGFGWPPLVSTTDDELEIAATCTLGELAAAAGDPAPLLRTAGSAPAPAPFTFPPSWTLAALIRECVDALVASFKICHLATVGGNVCLALPAGSMISLLSALDATALVWRADGGDERVLVADLVTGYGRTALAPGDLLRSFTLTGSALTARTAFARMSLSDRGRSAAVVIARQDADGAVTVSVTAATNRPYVLRFPDLPNIAEYAAAAADAIGGDYADDVHGAPDWRRHLVTVLGARTLNALEHPEPA